MYISSFSLQSYKSYIDLKDLQLSPGINVIVGQNDVGKSALLEGLGLNFKNNPYRASSRNLTFNDQKNERSIAQVAFSVSHDELWSILRSLPGQFFVPVPTLDVLVEANNSTVSGASEIEWARLHIEKMLARSEFTFEVEYAAESGEAIGHVQRNFGGYDSPVFPALKDYEIRGITNQRRYVACHINKEGILVLDREDEPLNNYNSQDGLFELRKPRVSEDLRNDLDFGLLVSKVLHKRIHLFKAQRSIEAKCKQEYQPELAEDARNLASFLNKIQGETPQLFRLMNQQLREILPQVYEATVQNLPPEFSNDMDRLRGFHEVLIYRDKGDNKTDAIPLGDSGTGVGQVLAILSISIASKEPRTVIIDEPQSFLHPGAVRKLIEILKKYPHQYIISTHSPEVITASNPSTIMLVEKEPASPSALKKIKTPTQVNSEHQDLMLCLESVGARLSDVFGADHVLWVEGKTEAKCFPIIVERLLKRPLLGAIIAYVDATGDLEGRDAERVLKIYERLSDGGGLVPRTLGFIFDREGKSDPQIADLKKRLGGERVRFLKRTMVENYFLNSDAIYDVLCSLEGLNKENIDRNKIVDAITTAIENTTLDDVRRERYYPKKFNRRPVSTLDGIHASNLLEDIFGAIAQTPYDKVKHGALLTEWLIDKKPSELDDLKDLLNEALEDPQNITV